jgi:DNA-directed RNA polymerase specialized sigma24 family protein
MVAHDSQVDEFTRFVTDRESRLRESLIAAFGGEIGRDAAAEALVYGWDNWDRIGLMENPSGYLFKVGLSRGRSALSKRRPVFDSVEPGRIPDVEPRLPEALSSLSERQRTVVLLIHSFQWTQSEVAALLGLSKSTIQNHLERGMAALRREIGDSS